MSPWTAIKVGLGILVHGAAAARDAYRDVKREQQQRLRRMQAEQEAARKGPAAPREDGL